MDSLDNNFEPAWMVATSCHMGWPSNLLFEDLRHRVAFLCGEQLGHELLELEFKIITHAYHYPHSDVSQDQEFLEGHHQYEHLIYFAQAVYQLVVANAAEPSFNLDIILGMAFELAC